MSKGLAVVLVLVFLTASVIMVKPVYSGSAVQNSWVEKAPMPSIYAAFGSATVNGTIYLFGVYNSSTGLNADNYAYDTSTNNWTEIAPMLTPRISFSVATYDNKI